VDFARTGKVTKREALRIMMGLHLSNVRAATIMELLKLSDDNDGKVAYDAFATLMMSEEPLHVAKSREGVAYSKGGPWMPQGGEPLVLEATMGRQFMPPRLPQTLLSNYRAHEAEWDLQSTLSARTSAEVFERGKPFDRTMWLERNKLRRQEEILAKHQAALRGFSSPRRVAKMTYEEGVMALSMRKMGGEAWTDWTRSSVNRPRPGMSPRPLTVHSPRSARQEAAAAPTAADAAPTPVKKEEKKPKMTEEEMREYRENLKKESFVKSTSIAVNQRFKDMYKAFQHIDIDGSGTLDMKEIMSALDKWNVQVPQEKIQQLMDAVDSDGNGTIDYKEFVDVLAHDTVAPAAMGKRGMSTLEATGVDGTEHLDYQVGRKTAAQKKKERDFHAGGGHRA